MFPTSSGSVVGSAGRPLPPVSQTPALILLLLGALALRLTLAYVLFPGSGFATDLNSYIAWANVMAERGPGGFYGSVWSDYPPGYLLVLWPIGLLGSFLGGDGGNATGELIKLPAIAADLAVGFLLYRLVLGWTWPGRRAPQLALIAAAVWLFNPVTIYDSAIWGQTDAVGALVMLLAVAALVRGNGEGSAALLAVAALMKPQFGIVLAPIVVGVLISRHLLRRGSAPRNRPWGPAAIRPWLAAEQGPLRLVTAGLAFVLVFLAIALPFGIGPIQYLSLMSQTAGGYPYLSVNAYNLWALLGAGGSPPLALAYAWSPDDVPLLGPLPGILIGTVLLALGFLWGFLRSILAADRWTILLAAVWLSLAFFFLPTRVHERYLFPVFAFLPLLAVASPRWMAALIAVAAGSFINLHGILMVPGYSTENIAGLPLGEAFGPGRPLPILVAILLQGTGLVLAGWELRRRIAPDPFERIAGELAGAVRRSVIPDLARPVGDPIPGAPMEAPVPGSAPRRVGGSGPLAAPTPSAGMEAAMPAPAGWDAWRTAASRVGRYLSAPRARADRSAGLARERGGTLTRKDAAALLAIVLAGLVLRGANLAHPYGMYFDEVYHARTALEFLQHWRYGYPHGIYEYTHPHLAKYLMAASVDLTGGNRVVATGRVADGAVADALVERRWSPDGDPGRRMGDRLWIAGPDGVTAIDLATGERTGPIGPAATALVLDADEHQLWIAGEDRTLRSIDTVAMDALRLGNADRPPLPDEIATLPPGAPVIDLVRTWDEVVLLDADGTLHTIDLTLRQVGPSLSLPGSIALSRAGDAEAVVADPTLIGDLATAAIPLAEALGIDAVAIEERLRTADGPVVLAAWPDDLVRETLQGPIDDGRLTGVSFASVPVVAVAAPAGVEIVDPSSLRILRTLGTESPVLGLGYMPYGTGEPLLYVAREGEVTAWRFDRTGPIPREPVRLPGSGGPVLWNDTASLIHVVGRTAAGEPTVWVIEPNGSSLFADARLPFTPVAVTLDLQPDRPEADRTGLIAVAADGASATVGVGGNAFAWRLPGVILGALTAALLYLLARILFRRRAVAVAVAVLALAEGMLFANARIAMNDVYITFFVVAALTLFAGLWTGRWTRAWQIAAGLMGVGLLLGLALASKWVAAYAIGGIILLVLFRSALGRLLALAGMVVLSAVLGAMALRAADVPDPSRNWLFPIVIILLTVALAAAIVRRPVRMTLDELRFATFVPIVLGVLALIAGGLLFLAPSDPAAPAPPDPRLALLAGIGLIVLGVGVLVAGRLAGAAGIGPLARPGLSRVGPEPSAPPPHAWLLPGAAGGIPWLLALACLTLIPLAVYVAAYLPWAALGNQLWPGFPAGNTGQTLWQLTLGMYDYHDGLRATHAATSPWWAWPLDLKPVWFYQEGFAGGRTGSIYDTGNLVVFWMGIAGLIFSAWAAWRRRSLALTLVIVLFLSMWIPWARIDRATFQYHVYASLPFIVLGLGYLVAELWHGPSRAAWLIARIAAALSLVGAPLLWLFRQPLCAIAGVTEMNPGATACAETVTRTITLSQQAIGILFVLLAGIAVALWIVQISGSTGAPGRNGRWGSVALLGTGGATLLGVVAARLLLSGDPISVEVADIFIALPALIALGIAAILVLRARDPRRLAVGILLAAILFLVAFIPNLSGLPVPSAMANIYQMLLPTWNYDFQFAVNMDPRVEGSTIRADTIVMGILILVAVAATVIAARSRPAPPAGRPPGG